MALSQTDMLIILVAVLIVAAGIYWYKKHHMDADKDAKKVAAMTLGHAYNAPYYQSSLPVQGATYLIQ
jgi:predicted transporter